jgi:hypothetical protein
MANVGEAPVNFADIDAPALSEDASERNQPQHRGKNLPVTKYASHLETRIFDLTAFVSADSSRQ